MTFVIYFIGGLAMGVILTLFNELIARLSGGETHELILFALLVIVPAIILPCLAYNGLSEWAVGLFGLGYLAILAIYGIKKSAD